MPNGDQISYKYNVRGDLVAIIDPKGNVTQYDYDGNHRLTKTLAQSAQSQLSTSGTRVGYVAEETQFFYDVADRLTRKEQILANEKQINGRYVTEYTYDALDRVIEQKVMHKRGSSVVEEFDDITYQYLKVLSEKLLTFVGNKYVDLHFIYETQPPYALISYRVAPTSVGLTLGLKAASFVVRPGMNGPVAQVERDGSVLIKNAYDEAGRLISAIGQFGGSSQNAILGYDYFGRRNSITHVSDTVQGIYTFDDADRVATISWTDNSTPVLTETLTYNKDGLIKQSQREIGTFTYDYSPKNEVNTISYSGSQSLPSAYVNGTLSQDSSGNLISYRGETFETFNNFTTKIGSAYYWPDYAGLGHMVGETRGSDVKSVTYFPDGKIREFKLFTSGSLVRKINYYYDGLGRRIAKVKDFTSDTDAKTTYTHFGSEERILLAEVVKGATTVESLYVDGQNIDDHLFEIDSSGTPNFSIQDHLGSLVSSLAQGGKSVYGLYGENLGTATNANLTVPVIYGFAGREYDPETGYYYSRARYYDPQSARFLTKDPLGPVAGGDVNAYRYVRNNPVNLVDPFGLKTQVIITRDTDYGILYGSHAAARVDNSGSPVLFDPNGSFNEPYRGSGALTADTSLSSYVDYHQRSGSKVEVYQFNTTAAQEADIALQAEAYQDPRLLNCASGVCDVLRGIGPFKNLNRTSLPGRLEDQLQSIPGGSCGGL